METIEKPYGGGKSGQLQLGSALIRDNQQHTQFLAGKMSPNIAVLEQANVHQRANSAMAAKTKTPSSARDEPYLSEVVTNVNTNSTTSK